MSVLIAGCCCITVVRKTGYSWAALIHGLPRETLKCPSGEIRAEGVGKDAKTMGEGRSCFC